MSSNDATSVLCSPPKKIEKLEPFLDNSEILFITIACCKDKTRQKPFVSKNVMGLRQSLGLSQFSLNMGPVGPKEVWFRPVGPCTLTD